MHRKIAMKKIILLIGILMILPLVYADTGIIDVNDNEIQIVVAGKQTSFTCNETKGNFQFALPDCDKTEAISCFAERKYNKIKIDEINNEMTNCKMQLQNIKCPDNTKSIMENSSLKYENGILKILIGISTLLVVSMVAVLMIFNYKNAKNQG